MQLNTTKKTASFGVFAQKKDESLANVAYILSLIKKAHCVSYVTRNQIKSAASNRII